MVVWGGKEVSAYPTSPGRLKLREATSDRSGCRRGSRAVLSSPFGDWNTRKKTCKRRSYRTYLLMRSRKLRAGGPARRLLEQENQRNAQQANDHQRPKLVDVRK
jgi:hypothetical protein